MNYDQPPGHGANPYAPPAPGSPLAGAYAAPYETLHGQVASRGSRLSAVLLDGLLYIPAFIPITIWAGTGGTAAFRDVDPEKISALWFFEVAPFHTWASVAIWLAIGALQAYLITTRGQSVGKRILGIKIVKMSGQPVGFVHGVLLRSWLFAVAGYVPFIGSVIGMVDPLFIFGNNRRCLHDLVAGTCVLKVHGPQGAPY